jgi:membrane fusion protein (multidrug efflux system)
MEWTPLRKWAAISAASLSLTLAVGIFVHERRYVWTNDAFLDGYQITISPDIEGRIVALYVDEGDLVSENQLLAQLDESIYLTKRADAATHVELLRAEIALKQIELAKLYDIYVVAKNEYDNQIISYIEFDKIEKNYHLAEAELEVAVKNLENGLAKLSVIDEILAHTKITAPRAGAIAKRWVVAGDMGKVGTPIFSLTDTDNIWVTANLEETKLEPVRDGDRVKIHVDAYPSEEFWGTVYKVRAAAASQFALIPPDNATGNYTKVVQRVPIKILLDRQQSSLYLYPGLSVEVEIKVR